MANLEVHYQHSEDINRLRKWHVIALSGVSCGGKTTLALELMNNIPVSSIYISQDEYILPNDYPGHLKAPEPLKGYNKDSLHSICMDQMISDIKFVLANEIKNINISALPHILDRKKTIGSALNSPRPAFYGFKTKSSLRPVLILDGFLLFNHPGIPPICNSMYFITLTKDQCKERRKNRVFTSPGMDATTYFDLCMWPKYEQHFLEMSASVKNIHYIDGNQSIGVIYNELSKDLMDILHNQDH